MCHDVSLVALSLVPLLLVVLSLVATVKNCRNPSSAMITVNIFIEIDRKEMFLAC